MKGFIFDLSCPYCGRDLEHVQSTPSIAGTEASAVVQCSNIRCHYEWHVIVHVRPVGILNEERRQPCGTDAGYKAHQKRHEPIDEACREAHDRAEEDRLAARQEAVSA